ncbi:hypothetical protein [Nocardiopsis tropica]|uniref:Uncharacterized protein n=1 Tax=Nocardiopsis tropica TaxID=109330 RepID=A0ABU7KWM3_9ACTN|nr:hypothetical protein [Nocardiopsis umidischolae]MEE2053702.1 hypothetical protein [Nocardiopsis umidischolae]
MEAIRRCALVTAVAPVTGGRTAGPTGLPAPGTGAPTVRRAAGPALPGFLPDLLPAADRLRRGHAPAGPR